MTKAHEDIQWCELHHGVCKTVHPFSRGHPMMRNSAVLVCTSCLLVLKKAGAVTEQTYGKWDYWQLTPVITTHPEVRWTLEADDPRTTRRRRRAKLRYEMDLTRDEAVLLRAHGYALRIMELG